MSAFFYEKRTQDSVIAPHGVPRGPVLRTVGPREEEEKQVRQIQDEFFRSRVEGAALRELTHTAHSNHAASLTPQFRRDALAEEGTDAVRLSEDHASNSVHSESDTSGKIPHPYQLFEVRGAAPEKEEKKDASSAGPSVISAAQLGRPAQ